MLFLFMLYHHHTSRRAFYWTECNDTIICFSGFFFPSVALSYFIIQKFLQVDQIIPAVGYFHAFIKIRLTVFSVNIPVTFSLSVILLTLLKISSSFTYLKFYHIFYSLHSRSYKIYLMTSNLKIGSSSIILVSY